MKHLLYVSEINSSLVGPQVPNGLFDIFQQAKKFNQSNKISGVLAYSAGHYLQVIEGSDFMVDALFEKIDKDGRHKNVTVIIEKHCRSRKFHNWRFESGLDLSRNLEFRSFMDAYHAELASQSHEDKEVISMFYKPFWESHFEAPRFENTELSLVKWPKLNRIGQTPEIVNFCANLLNGPMSYLDLIESDKFGHNFDLNYVLLEFKLQGVLKVERSNTQSNRTPTVLVANSFLQKMKSFLSVKH